MFVTDKQTQTEPVVIIDCGCRNLTQVGTTVQETKVRSYNAFLQSTSTVCNCLGLSVHGTMATRTETIEKVELERFRECTSCPAEHHEPIKIKIYKSVSDNIYQQGLLTHSAIKKITNFDKRPTSLSDSLLKSDHDAQEYHRHHQVHLFNWDLENFEQDAQPKLLEINFVHGVMCVTNSLDPSDSDLLDEL